MAQKSLGLTYVAAEGLNHAFVRLFLYSETFTARLAPTRTLGN